MCHCHCDVSNMHKCTLFSMGLKRSCACSFVHLKMHKCTNAQFLAFDGTPSEANHRSSINETDQCDWRERAFPTMTTAPTMMEQQHQVVMSEYETTRAQNIERNNAKLRSLGLISAREEEISNAAAWGRPMPTAQVEGVKDDDDEEYKEEEEEEEEATPPTRGKKKRARKEKKKPSSLHSSRKSLRVKGLDPNGSSPTTKEKETPHTSSAQASLEEQRRQRREECREARQRAAIEHAALGADKAAKENPTATYEHCLHHVRTMSHKQLQNRVRTIERAAGKHCVVKMAIFGSCLQDEGLYDLAEIATAALERLKALQPPPPPPPPSSSLSDP